MLPIDVPTDECSTASEPRAVRDFLALTSLEEREILLQEHLFWKDPHVSEHLSGRALIASIEHIRARLLDYAAKNPEPKAIRTSIAKASPGLFWSTPGQWNRWQQRLLALRNDIDWGHAQHLLHVVLRYGALNIDSAHPDGMLPYVEQMMNNGMVFDVDCLLRVAWWASYENPNPLVQLNAYPLTLAQLKDPQNLMELQRISLNGPGAVHWLNKINPRIDAWNLAERCTTRGQLTALHNQLHDAALFKAWHGMPLTLEEVQIHPLAQALYVHRHAPVYLSEVMVLPDHWRLALELATTGEHFKQLLLQAQSKDRTAEILPLPAHFTVESPTLGS